MKKNNINIFYKRIPSEINVKTNESFHYFVFKG